MSARSTTSILEPLPTTLVKACLPTLSSLITQIVHSSLSNGIVPSVLKTTSVTPILKKPGLNPYEFNNYRPISNLPFISKLIERTVACQLQDHLSNNNLFEPFQSGVRPHHSTETALTQITNDLLLASDSGLLTILILLDLSAAFDTISHSILLDRLAGTGVSGIPLQWFHSYLSDRSLFIQGQNTRSSPSPLLHGVPQGSVLGPLLFIIYILPLGNIFRHFGIHFHCYADDTQIYITTKPDTTSPPTALIDCLQTITNWLSINKLKLNGNKSEILLIGSKSSLSKSHPLSIHIDGCLVPTSKTVKSLGVTLDSTLSFTSHINNISRTAFFHLRNISRLRPSLTQHSTEILINALVTSRLDYCNSLLTGLPQKLIHRLQTIQNTAARIITRTKSSDHITPVLMQLHWLPIHQLIHYKLLLLTFKALHNQAPPYLSNMLHPYIPPRPLRSSSAALLSTPSFSLISLGAQAFSCSAPRLWNSLPLHIRTLDSIDTFKSHLKTHLFKLAYSV